MSLPKQPAAYLRHFPKARLKITRRPGRCPLYGCRQPSRCKGVLCARHSLRLWRATSPLNSFFAQIRDRAVRRGQGFTITRQQFIDLVADTGYMEQRGRGACMLHLDRIDHTRGYEPGNLRVITAKENCVKARAERRHKEAMRSAGLPVDEDPF